MITFSKPHQLIACAGLLSMILPFVFGLTALSSSVSFELVPTVEASDPLGDASEIGGINDYGGEGTDLRDKIRAVVLEVMLYTALLATAVIIIGGIILIVGLGSDESREKTKKIVIYTIVGMALIVLAEGIVVFVTTILP